MNKKIVLLTIVILLLNSCAPNATPNATATSIKTVVATSIPLTERPHILLQQDTTLYSGPGTDFDSIETLKAGAIIYPIGIYVDFVEINTQEGETGYVWKDILENIPELSSLSKDNVLWKPVKMWLYQSSPNMAMSFKNNDLTVDNSKNSEYYGNAYGPISLANKVRFEINFKSSDTGSVMTLVGRKNIYAEWWRGVHEIFINQNGDVDVYDGTSDQSIAHLKINDLNGTVYVYSNDIQGKQLVFENDKGETLLNVDFSKLPGAQLQDGLFPDKVAYIGLIASPFALLTIQTPLVSKLPDGIYHPVQRTLRQLADQRGLILSASSLNYWQLFNPPYYQALIGMANQYVIAGELDPQVVFAKFTQKDWEDIISNWDNVSGEIDKGNIPSDYSYDWQQADNVVYFAQQNQMSIRAQHLIWGPDLPDIFYKGVFSTSELEKLLEFMVKVRVLKYKGMIQEWDGADEACARSLYPGGKDGFWYTHFPIDIVDKVFAWTHEADPNAKLVFMEELNFGSQEWSGYNRLSQCYLGQLKKFKANNIPVDYAGLEMNSWIYDPPSEKIMINFMEQVKGLGYQFSSAEANAVTSPDKYPAAPGRPKTITKIDDPLAAQAQVYHDVLEAYLTVGSRAFGISGVDDGNEWFASVGDPEAHSMIYDANFTPKPAYFVIQDLLTNFVAITPTPTP